MRLLANENVPLDVVKALQVAGHDVVWVRRESPGASDLEILVAAEADGRHVLTFDKDFGELAVRHETGPGIGVILIRMTLRAPDSVARLLVSAFAQEHEWGDHLAVIDETRIRFVRLTTCEASMPPPFRPAAFPGRLEPIRARAEAEACRRNHSFIASEHILIAICEAAEGIGAAWLAERSVTADAIRSEVDRLVRNGSEPPPPYPPPLTPRAAQHVASAERLAHRRGESEPSTDDLLAATIADRGGTAAQALIGLSVNLSELQRRLR